MTWSAASCLSRASGPTYPGVHVQDLAAVPAHEQEAVAGLVNHLKVGARVGRGHVSFPVVKAAEKWKQL